MDAPLATFPANFMLIATMNPCPCGFFGDPEKTCTCSVSQIMNYQKKLSGPLLDRIDILINVQKVPPTSLLRPQYTSNSEHSVVKNKISLAIHRQHSRYQNPCLSNSSLSSAEITKFLTLSPPVEALLRSAANNLNLSARSFFKTIKVARTIADFEGCSDIKIEHVSEALSYRLDQFQSPFTVNGKTLARTPKV